MKGWRAGSDSGSDVLGSPARVTLPRHYPGTALAGKCKSIKQSIVPRGLGCVPHALAH